ncbi:hypothetical protein Cme02nite_29270 [Catellatospora methionotrophica]|uniref:HAF repeat-containing protein n=1 Tax=Catellatospora methionotrophica TaxID=121620 RepID=A0A8J3LKV1_9ACTN|nr:hypothetical protein [Catellatospora methionotrophica]GIG14595.1 hypothetical protein Cme02nite_29270 [Catellatospora methionotrophica]
MLSASVAAAIALSVTFSAAPASASGGLHAVDLGTLTGTCCSQAFAINDHGVVVGSSQVGAGENPPEHAFRWKDGVMIDLGTLGGTRSGAAAVNNNGWIVGGSTLSSGAMRPFLWRPGLGMIDLGSLGGESFATGVNDAGMVVGQYVLAGELRGFRWVNGVLSDLNTPDGTGFKASGVNKNGKISGTHVSQPATWKNGLTVLSGLVGDGTAVNDSGDVSYDSAQYPASVGVWRANGTLLALTPPPNTVDAATTGINESRHTVGWRATAAGNYRGVYWSEFGTPNLLPGLVAGGQSMAWGVNRLGQTVGQANLTATGGEYHAVLWTN